MRPPPPRQARGHEQARSTFASAGPSLLAFALAVSSCAAAQLTGPARLYDVTWSGLGAGGYDVVAYFTDHVAVPGKPGLTVVDRGVVYRFASPAHRRRFLGDPDKYLPAWGGNCAWAVAHRGTFGSTPTSFLIRDGRLFLFHDSIFFDAKATWLRERGPTQAELVRSGDAYWAELVARASQREVEEGQESQDAHHQVRARAAKTQ